MEGRISIKFPEYKTPLLFQNPDIPIDLEIIADFNTLMKQDFQGNAEGSIHFHDNNSSPEGTLKVRLRQRGHLRRRVQIIKPLEIDILEGDQLHKKDSLFPENKSFDLVTHPSGNQDKTNSKVNQNILKEFFFYRLSNLINAPSMLVRLARVKYLNPDQSLVGAGYAIIRESKKSLAHRVGLTKIDQKTDSPRDPSWGVNKFKVQLFELLIKNCDYVFSTLQNMVGLKNSSNDVFYVPYDFDMTQSIWADYPSPSIADNIKPAIAGSVYLAHLYYSEIYSHLKHASSSESIEETKLVHKNLINLLQFPLQQFDKAREILKRLPLERSSQADLENILRNYENGVKTFLKSYSEYSQFKNNVMTPDWVLKQQQSIKDHNDFYANINLRAASTLGDFYSRLNTIQGYSKHYAVLENIQHFLDLDPYPSDFLELKKHLTDIGSIVSIMTEALTVIHSPEDFVNVTHLGIPSPTEGYKTFNDEFILKNLDLFFKMNPTGQHILSLKMNTSFVPNASTLMTEALKVIHSPEDFVQLTKLGVPEPSEEYKKACDEFILKHLDLFFKMNPTGQHILSLKMNTSFVPNASTLMTEALKVIHSPEDFVSATQLGFPSSTEYYKTFNDEFILKNLNPFFKMNPSSQHVRSLRNGTTYVSTAITITESAIKRAHTPEDFEGLFVTDKDSNPNHLAALAELRNHHLRALYRLQKIKAIHQSDLSQMDKASLPH